MSRHTLCLIASAVLATVCTSTWAEAPRDGDYRDTAEVQAELLKVLTCQASRTEYERLHYALTPIYYGDRTQPAMADWRLSRDEKTWEASLNLPKPVTVYGHTTSQLAMEGEGLLVAVLDGDLVDALSGELKLGPTMKLSDKQIRTRTLSVLHFSKKEITIVQTVGTSAAQPGKTIVGCDYQITGEH